MVAQDQGSRIPWLCQPLTLRLLDSGEFHRAHWSRVAEGTGVGVEVGGRPKGSDYFLTSMN